MLAVLVILGGSLSALSYSNYSVNAWGTIVGLTSNQWVRLETVKTGANAFSYKGTYEGSSMTNVNYMSYYFLTDTTSISNFSITIHECNTALTNLPNWGSYSIYIYQYNNGQISGGTNITNVTIYNPVLQEDGTWIISWDYIGDAVSGAVVRLSLRTSPYVLNSIEWKQFTVDKFNVNGQNYVFTDGEQTIINNLEAISGAINEDVPLPSAVPSLEEIGGEIVNEGIDLAQSWVQYFTTNFDIAGAMGRVVKPFSDYFLVLPNDGNVAHTTLVVIMLFSLGAVIVVWFINKLKRRQDDA